MSSGKANFKPGPGGVEGVAGRKAPSSPRLKLVAIWCWYRGAGFHGYQRQQDRRTVQGELLRAFSSAGLVRNPVAAGRTDRGVSARMQVLSLRLQRELDPDEVLARLRPRLPEDLGVHLAREVPWGFHAAWSATEKEYRYALGPGEVGDLPRLREAAALVPGTRDFRVFHFKTSEQKARTVHRLEVLPGEAGVTLRFVGQRFARHMVRMLVGGLTQVSRGEVSLDVLRQGLEAQRPFGCPTAPPEPLTLWSVGYPPESDPFTEAEREAFTWPRAGAAVSGPGNRPVAGASNPSGVARPSGGRMPSLQIVIASTRTQRAGPSVARWFLERARRHGKFELELVDLKEVALPLLDEPNHPVKRNYQFEHTKAWSAKVAAADAFVFVTPEYNYGMAPALLNALDYLSHEWAYKAAGFVSYGGVSGGTRSVQMAKQVMTSLKLVPLPEGVAIPFYAKHLDAAGTFDPGDTQDEACARMLDELFKWTGALKTLRP
jgi:tRNA pseudouridine(38-40) synthase